MQLGHHYVKLLSVFVAAALMQSDAVSLVGRSRSNLSPITRTVELLNELSKVIERESRDEEKLFDAFVCWAKGMIGKKSESNAAAKARIENLNTRINDIESGRVEFTSERVDLTKEISELSDGIESASRKREDEKQQFQASQEEMDMAISALESAIDVLKEATKDDENVAPASQVQVGFAQVGFNARAKEAESLSLAIKLGKQVLSKSDSVYLEKLLTADVPEKPDWKKLNREATFKKKYKGRSFEIQDVLEQMRENFRRRASEALVQEQDAQQLFDTLSKSQGDRKSAAEQALLDMVQENGAKGLSKTEAEEEVSTLEKQVKDDKKYLDEVQTSLDDKKKEWQERSTLRTGELAAISQAIGILHDDDNRDLFKRSLASQGAAFFQVATSSRLQTVADTLKVTARKGHDDRVARIASQARRAGAEEFKAVVDAIDVMLTQLEKEEADDLKMKEDCEKSRAENTRSAVVSSREIDELTEQIADDKVLKKELNNEIEEKNELIKTNRADMDEVNAMWKKEDDTYKVDKKDDEDAKKVVESATEVLKQFYQENEVALMQQRGMAAPQEPPATWDAPYAGKVDEKTGIIAIMEMIAADIQKDLDKATAEHDKAKTLFETNVEELDATHENLKTDIGKLETQVSDKVDSIQQAGTARRGKRDTLGGLRKTISDQEPNCNFFTVNYPIRANNRQIEVDGLHKAKTILSGGEFTAKDPNREINPGDAMTQIRQRKFLSPVRAI